MNECDIYVAEEILKRLKNRNGCVTGVDIEELVTDEGNIIVFAVHCATLARL